MSRAPLIAGNWKMNKTVAEAERYVAGAAAAASRASTASRSRSARRSPRSAPMVDAHARIARRGVRAEHARGAAGRVHRRDLGADAASSSASPASSSATPSAAQLFGETDRALAQKVAGGARRRAAPILCVGETEEERLAGETERKLRHQVQEGLEQVPKERLGEVAIAYEPIWAIGTGQVATAEQAQEAASFVRALVGSAANGAAASWCACSTVAR